MIKVGINRKYLQKYEEHYKDLKDVTAPIEFLPESEFYRQEEWRPVIQRYVPDVLEGAYKISTYGRIYTYIKSPCYPNGGIMKPSKNEHGYHQINLKNANPNGNKICVKIARLVMLHFRFKQGCEYLEVDHIDGNKDNNCIWNLEWVSPQINVHRAINNNLRTLSVYKDSGTLLSDEDAHRLYSQAVNLELSYEKLAEMYNVSVDYIDRLVEGKIRPYIANRYNYKSIHRE